MEFSISPISSLIKMEFIIKSEKLLLHLLALAPTPRWEIVDGAKAFKAGRIAHERVSEIFQVIVSRYLTIMWDFLIIPTETLLFPADNLNKYSASIRWEKNMKIKWISIRSSTFLHFFYLFYLSLHSLPSHRTAWERGANFFLWKLKSN